MKTIIRTLAFFSKELNEIRRQPRLILGLVLGPVLILLLFGVGYARSTPELITGIVIPADAGLDSETQQEILGLIGLNFTIVTTDTDRARLDGMLRSGQLEVVQVFPADMRQRIEAGQQTEIAVETNVINPQEEGWIQYLTYAQVSEINRVLLTDATRALQGEAATAADTMDTLRARVTRLNNAPGQDEIAQAGDDIRVVRENGTIDSVTSPLLDRADPDDPDGSGARATSQELKQDLEALERATDSGDVSGEQERIARIDRNIERLSSRVRRLSSVAPEAIVSPIQQRYTNIAPGGKAYPLVTFFAPGVLALLIQHTAVTLGALALVRERMQGAMEIFQVAPVSGRHLLVGKYASYTLFVLIIGGLLTAALTLLGIPRPVDPWQFAGLLAMLTIASLGVGFLISAVSNSDSQAIQYSMLVLLLSIMFSGFFIPLEYFLPFISAIGMGIPMTHGIDGMHSLLLRGTNADIIVWIGLGAIALVTFVIVTVIVARQFRTAAH